MAVFKTSDVNLYILKAAADGRNFSDINGGNPVYTNPRDPSYGVRDPSIRYNAPDQKWYIAHTDNDAFVVLSSPDLYNWTQVARVTVPGLARIWSPEWFVDPLDSSIHLVHAGNPIANISTGWAIYETHPTASDFSTWSTSVALGGSFSSSLIDPYIIKIGSTYNLWVKNEIDKTIELATSSSLLTGYTMLQTGDWAGWGAPRFEGACVLPFGPGYRLYMDHSLGVGAGDGIYFSDSPPGSLGTPWTAPVLTTFQPLTGIRHGTVVHLP